MMNSKNLMYGWAGTSDLFMKIVEGKAILLDVEFDGDELHSLCGGMDTYVSISGMTGNGYLETLGPLIPIGLYRVDTAYNEWQYFMPLGKTPKGEQLFAAVPYRKHTEEKSEVLRDYPTVIKVGNKVVYCDFYANFLEILALLLTGQELPEMCVINGCTFPQRGHRTLKKVVSNFSKIWGTTREEIVSMEHYNLCSMEKTPNAWEFFREELKDYQAVAAWEQERMFQLLAIEEMSDGTFVRTFKVQDRRYRGRKLEGNPLKAGGLTAGWQRLAEDVLVRFYDGSNEAHLVAYASADEAYAKAARRLATRMGEGEEFISYVSTHGDRRYVEFEQVIPKVLYLLDPAGHVATARRGLAKKVREDLIAKTRQWVDGINDRAMLEAIPDSLVIKLEDSYTSGNCVPGTQAFVDRFFPGKTETTAGELKKHAEKYHVMRVLRYVASREGISGKTISLPE